MGSRCQCNLQKLKDPWKYLGFSQNQKFQVIGFECQWYVYLWCYGTHYTLNMYP